MQLPYAQHVSYVLGVCLELCADCLQLGAMCLPARQHLLTGHLASCNQHQKLKWQRCQAFMYRRCAKTSDPFGRLAAHAQGGAGQVRTGLDQPFVREVEYLTLRMPSASMPVSLRMASY